MALYYTKEKNLTDIADALRRRFKNNELRFTPQQMVDAISNIVYPELPSITINIDPAYNEHQRIIVTSDIYNSNTEFNILDSISLHAYIKTDEGWFTDGLRDDNYDVIADWGDTINFGFKNAARNYTLSLYNYVQRNFDQSYYMNGTMYELPEYSVEEIKTNILGGSAENAFKDANVLTTLSDIDTTIDTSKITNMKKYV